jgi:hypothetical protein
MFLNRSKGQQGLQMKTKNCSHSNHDKGKSTDDNKNSSDLDPARMATC